MTGPSRLGSRPFLVAGLCLIPLSALLVRSETIARWLARQQGYVILIERPERVWTVQQPGETTTLHFEVVNVSDQPVKIIGAETHCGCATLTDLPRTILPHQADVLELKLDSTGRQAGETYVQPATLFVDRPSPPLEIRVQISITAHETTRQSSSTGFENEKLLPVPESRTSATVEENPVIVAGSGRPEKKRRME